MDLYLNDAEGKRIDELLHTTKWGDPEIAEVKRLSEHAEWFAKLRHEAE